jgi:hypothetical protein
MHQTVVGWYRRDGQQLYSRSGSARSSIYIGAIFILMSVFGAGCAPGQVTVWSKQVRSPDGQWVAIGRTDQHSGPGNAAIITGVYLSRPDNAYPEQPVLHFLDDFPPGKGGIEITLVWLTSSHLQVTFSRHPDLNFQLVKYAGIDISVQDLPN